MRILPLFFILLLTPITTSAQDTARAILFDQTVEFVAEGDGVGEPSAVQMISIRADGKPVKRFATPRGVSLTVVATFNAYEGDYLLLRTSMGQGACAGGNLYALKFNQADGHPDQISVVVSPMLTTCLGEWPPVKFAYRKKGDLVIGVSGHELRSPWIRWVRERKM